MAEAAAPEQQGPTLEQLVGQLAGQVGQLHRTVETQSQTLQQLAHGTAQVAQVAQRGSQPAVDPDAYSRANDQYLKTLATDALGLRKAENQSLANEILGIVRQEIHQNVGEAERRRRSEELERGIYANNPDLGSEGPFIEFYLTHLNRNPQSAGWQIGDKINQAVEWARQNKAEREQQIVQQYERSKKEQARAAMPGGSSFRDPGTAQVETAESAEEANKKRFELLQGRKAAASAGGRYTK
jgi:hypothetical protein